MIVSTGWTHDRIYRMQMRDVVELLDYLAEYPTADAVLRARYLKPRDSKPLDEKAAMNQLAELQFDVGMGPAEAMPAHLKDLADWADAALGKKKSN